MSRVRLQLPEVFRFSTEIPVRISDVNYGGHVGNDAMLSIAHEARIRFLGSLGYTEREVEGRALIMADAVLQYRSEAFHGDVLIVHVEPAEFSGVGFDLYYRITNRANGREVARIKTGMVFVDERSRKPAEVPALFRRRCETDTPTAAGESRSV